MTVLGHAQPDTIGLTRELAQIYGGIKRLFDVQLDIHPRPAQS